MNNNLSQTFHSSSKADILVVGAGLTGLAAATYTARSGRRVTLFEKASEPGGRAISRQRDGFSLNLGAHALYHQAEAGEVLRELGVAYRGKEPPPVFALAGDTLHLMPQSPLALLRTMLFDAPAKLELLGVLASAKRADLLALQTISVSEWLKLHVRHPQVRAFLLMLARVTTYTNAPEVQSASAKLAPESGAVIHTIRYLEPGEQADAKAFEQELEALLDRLQPGWRREVVARQFLPHMHATNAIVQAHFGGLPGRPGPEVPGIGNLFVAGDWVGTAGQLTAAGLASARAAARLACEQTLRRGGVDEAAYSAVGK